ncbi:hypothetical protein BKA80DRAFT_310878 [Phyllosticta citrichinensis]
MSSKRPRKSESLHMSGQQAPTDGEENTTTIAAIFGGFVTQYNDDGRGTLKIPVGSKNQQRQEQFPNEQKFEYPEPTTWEESCDYKYRGYKPPPTPSRPEFEEQQESDESIYSPDTMLARFKHGGPRQPKKSIDPSLIDPCLLEMSDQPTGASSQNFKSGKPGDKQNADKAGSNNAGQSADNARTCD